MVDVDLNNKSSILVISQAIFIFRHVAMYIFENFFSFYKGLFISSKLE